MKKLVLLSLTALLLVVINACSNREVAVQDTSPGKEEILMMLETYPFFIAEASRQTGNETMDLLADSVNNSNRDHLYLKFRDGEVLFYAGSLFSNSQFPATAKTISVLTRILHPTNLKYRWDDSAGTVLVWSEGTSQTVPMVPDGKKASLDKTSFQIYNTLEEAQNATVPPSMTFVMNDTDPKLGQVIYNFTLKPMYAFRRPPNQQNYDEFVVF